MAGNKRKAKIGRGNNKVPKSTENSSPRSSTTGSPDKRNSSSSSSEEKKTSPRGKGIVCRKSNGAASELVVQAFHIFKTHTRNSSVFYRIMGRTETGQSFNFQYWGKHNICEPGQWYVIKNGSHNTDEVKKKWGYGEDVSMKSNSATKIVVAEEEQYEDAKSPDKSWPVMAEEVPTQTANREVFIRAIVTGASGSILRIGNSSGQPLFISFHGEVMPCMLVLPASSLPRDDLEGAELCLGVKFHRNKLWASLFQIMTPSPTPYTHRHEICGYHATLYPILPRYQDYATVHVVNLVTPYTPDGGAILDIAPMTDANKHIRKVTHDNADLFTIDTVKLTHQAAKQLYVYSSPEQMNKIQDDGEAVDGVEDGLREPMLVYIDGDMPGKTRTVYCVQRLDPNSIGNGFDHTQ